MQSHLMNKRRSEVSVAPLRPLALNRATSEILPYRGTLFLKGESENKQRGERTRERLWNKAAVDGMWHVCRARVVNHARVVALLDVRGCGVIVTTTERAEFISLAYTH